MIVKTLQLTNFRSYDNFKIDFSDKINIIIGNNGVGKTNLVEAIYYLSLGRSFKNVSDKVLIKNNASTAFIKLAVINDALTHEIRCYIDKKGKKITFNDKPVVRLSDLNKIMNAVIFVPNDVNFFKDSPRVRRQYFDVCIAKYANEYLYCLSAHRKILKERNELLKLKDTDLLRLEIVTNQLIEVSQSIVKFRLNYINEINAVLTKIIKAISNKNMVVKIIYRPFAELNNDFVENATKMYQESTNLDLITKTTNVGIHREDFIALKDGVNINEIASQGETRIIVLALKLCQYFMFKDKKEKPIIILDDVLSELDDEHQKSLLVFLQKLEQVFITSTKWSYKATNVSIYEINNHVITRR